MAEQCDSVHSAIVDIETRLDGKHAVEIKALKNAIKILNLEHKVEMLEKIHDKEIQIQAKEIQILKLENECKMLKLKYNDVQEDTTSLKNEKQTESIKALMSQKGVNEFYMMNTDDLLTKDIAKFFGVELQNSYSEWFEVMAARMTKNTPFIFEKSVMVKVTCKNPAARFFFYSCERNEYTVNAAYLDIFNKGWKHDATSVLILHPNLNNKSIQMKESCTTISYHE